MSFDLKKTNNFQEEKKEAQLIVEDSNKEKIESDFHSWKAPEFEVYERNGRWYLIATILLGIIVVYAMVTDSLLMAITFILLGVVGYIHLQKEPRILEFAITAHGVQAGKELYPYDNIKSFWIFYDPPHTKTISLHVKSAMLPFVHIPLANEDPTEIRKKLLRFIDEKKQDPSFVDTIERVLGI